MVMSSLRSEDSFSAKKNRIFESDVFDFLPDLKRQKVDVIQPVERNSGARVRKVSERCCDCSAETENGSAKIGSEIGKILPLDKSVPCKVSDCKDNFLLNAKSDEVIEWQSCEEGSAFGREVEEGEIVEEMEIVEDGEIVEEGKIVEEAISDEVEVETGKVVDEVETGKVVDEVETRKVVDEVEVGKVVVEDGKNKHLPDNRSASSGDVEEGQIIEDINKYAEAATGKGAEAEKDKLVDCKVIVCDNHDGIRSRDDIMKYYSKKCIRYNSEGDNTGSKMCSRGTKSAATKQEKRISNGASTVAIVNRCKAPADGSNKLILKPGKTSFSKKNFSKGGSLINGMEAGEQYKEALSDGKVNIRGTLPNKESNDLSVVLSDSPEALDRSNVKETLSLYRQVLEKLLLIKEKVSVYTYVEAAMQLKEQGKWVNTNKRALGAVPGVEIGDKFRCRAELVIIGLHHPFAAGIDSIELDGKKIATSIVASGRYANETEFTDTLIYSGEGGNPAIKDRELRDQTLERGNLALKNSMDAETPVRVIRGYRAWKSYRAGDRKREKEVTFTYDGLYVVSKYWQEKGRHGNLIYMFQLNRMKDQPKLTSNSLSNSAEKSKMSGISGLPTVSSRSRKFKALLSRAGKSKTKTLRISGESEVHHNPIKTLSISGESEVHHNPIKTLSISGESEVHTNPIVVEDIACGKENIAIRVVNDIDDDKPPMFNYIANMVYTQLPDSSVAKSGCGCINGCSDSVKCRCVKKNRGKVPFNEFGAIIRQKSIVYECGPSCKCPPSCKNRVSQLGLRFQLEVFKTESRGWGVRSREFIPSGSFICEYVGELLDDMQAEERIDCDEYLFNLGDDDGFAVDAAIYGNIGRFLNHSCSPNLYAQNVLFGHGDKKMPHVMLFATEDIPPLQELTFDYNYKIDQVYDVYGNVKKKMCRCGSLDCTGRMY